LWHFTPDSAWRSLGAFTQLRRTLIGASVRTRLAAISEQLPDKGDALRSGHERCAASKSAFSAASE